RLPRRDRMQQRVAARAQHDRLVECAQAAAQRAGHRPHRRRSLLRAARRIACNLEGRSMTHLVAELKAEAHDAIALMRAAALRAADRMAWRSMCAHGWWAQVKPAPAGLGREDRAWPGQPFWEDGCLPECAGD